MPKIIGTETLEVTKTGFPLNLALSELKEYFNPITTALLTDAAGSNATGAQSVFPTNGTFTAESRTFYKFEAFYNITRAAGTTSHTTSLLFGGTATFSAIDYLVEISNPTGNILGTSSHIMINAATAVAVTAANTSATENIRARLSGIMRVDVPGTIIPQFSYSAAPGGVPTIKRGSYFCMIPMGYRGLVTAGVGWA